MCGERRLAQLLKQLVPGCAPIRFAALTFPLGLQEVVASLAGVVSGVSRALRPLLSAAERVSGSFRRWPL